MCEPYQSILCHECAHVETDECGAPEFFSNGSKVLLVKGDNGKVDLDAVAEMVHRRQDIHYPRPRVLSLTETTELGTVYSVEEVQAAGRRARELGLRVHMDGARLANALVALKVAPKEITWQAGVDVLSLGGGKNGMGIGEAVVFFNKALATDFDYRCKQAGQLCSKMRFIAAPWIGVLENGAWLRYAERANAAAARLAAAITKAGLPLMFPRQANSVFVQFPPGMVEKLRERGWRFYTFIGCGGARFMCGWDTTTEDVDALAGDLCSLLSQR
jgi:threonine aldolase